MQPPPRKGNYAKFLKTLHAEQIAKLQAKNQHECELLDDLRNFIIKRSAIERSYSEALLKISSAFLNKKIPNIPDIKTEGGEEKWNMWNVWRTVLEENEKLARARLAAVEVFQQHIADDAKILRQHKLQVTRKGLDTLAIVQKELQVTVQEVDKTKKFYFDEEHSAHDVRDKAKDIEEKLKKKKGSFFQSITSLQKNSAKVSSKRDALEEKSTGARNDYILSLASANAHQTRYFLVDLQQTMLAMESQVYEKVAEYLMLVGRTELLTCSATQHSFTRIRDQAHQLTREYNLQCLYLFYPVLKQHIQYEFEACDDDPTERVTAEHPTAVATLSKEARRMATRMSRENNNIRECNRKLQALQALKDSGQKTDPNDQNGPDIETKMEELKQSIRRSETSKVKTEARLECLRNGGVNVDEWMQEVDTLDVRDVARSTSSLSMRTDASGTGEPQSSDSFYDSDFTDGGSEQVERRAGGAAAASASASHDYDDDDEDRPGSTEVDGEWGLKDNHDGGTADTMLEQERQRIEQLTAGWEDPTTAWGTEDAEDSAPGMDFSAGIDTSADDRPSAASAGGPTYKCIALYSYTAQNPDELTIVENEQLEVVGEGDGEGWLCARNYRGEEGFVPSNYLDVDRDAANSSLQAGASNYQLSNQISFSSVDYTVGGEAESALPEEPPPVADVEVHRESVSSAPPPKAEPPSTAPHLPPLQSADVCYCRAQYDYEATCEEELDFCEGDVIRILRKVVHDDVDDGWWEGELNGRVGLFPSLVVEECRPDGEPLTPEGDATPPMSAPPVFTPPEAPSFFLAPQQVIITQATPLVEDPDEARQVAADEQMAPAAPSPAPAPVVVKKSGFSMKMETEKHKQYDRQFEAKGDTGNVPTVTVQVDGEDEDEDETEVEVGEDGDDPGLCVASIVITCATPMVEEAESSFPPPPPEDKQTPPDEADEDQATDSAPFPVSSSTGSEESNTGPSTTENSQSQAPPSKAAIAAAVAAAAAEKEKEKASPPEPEEEDVPVMLSGAGGKAVVPDELEPHQLEKLQDLKESDA